MVSLKVRSRQPATICRHLYDFFTTKIAAFIAGKYAEKFNCYRSAIGQESLNTDWRIVGDQSLIVRRSIADNRKSSDNRSATKWRSVAGGVDVFQEIFHLYIVHCFHGCSTMAFQVKYCRIWRENAALALNCFFTDAVDLVSFDHVVLIPQSSI